MNHYLGTNIKTLYGLSLVCTFLVCTASVSAQEVIAPPALGEQTKGTPADISDPVTEVASTQQTSSEAKQSDEEQNYGLLGRTDIDEQKRENGQIYRIELKHSSGSTQYIEENDSDGKLESTDNDIEVTPNLAKWKLGSW